MHIRFAQATDLNSIQKVIETAFSDQENTVIMNLAAELSSENTRPPIQSLVAEVDNQVAGYVSCSPIFLSSHAGICGYILAPLAILPNHRKQGIGSNLIKSGIELLAKQSVDVLLVYGDPDYYGRFGFKHSTARSFVPPYPLEYPCGWLGMMLSDIDIPAAPIEFACVSSFNKPDLW